MLTFAFAALTMKSVGRAANDMIIEVRRQFAEIPGLREGREGVKAEYAKCVDISTKASLREMILPGSLAVIVPLVVGFYSRRRSVACSRARSSPASSSPSSWRTPVAPGTTPRSTSRPGTTAARAPRPTRPPSSATPSVTRSRTPPGPAMNILIKVMTIVALVFASAFV
jgi:K(+)-stimulated pyrophosphate-energized sodium pump